MSIAPALIDRPATGQPRVMRPVVEWFKQDRKSRVWRVQDEQGRSWVVKRFERPAWRQRLAVLLRIHPAWKERRWHTALSEQGLPVVRIMEHGIDEQGRHWLASPYVGVSLYNWLRLTPPGRSAMRHDLTRQAGRLTGELLARRLYNRDHKGSNLVIDSAGKLWLIDAGGCRSSRGLPWIAAALPMLLKMQQNLQAAADAHENPSAVRLTRADRLRFFRAMIACWPTMPDGSQHLLRHKDFMRS